MATNNPVQVQTEVPELQKADKIKGCPLKPNAENCINNSPPKHTSI